MSGSVGVRRPDPVRIQGALRAKIGPTLGLVSKRELRRARGFWRCKVLHILGTGGITRDPFPAVQLDEAGGRRGEGSPLRVFEAVTHVLRDLVSRRSLRLGPPELDNPSTVVESMRALETGEIALAPASTSNSCASG